ncbi:hypothetical protein QBZ16_005404 [Prototheca wickerhamii]|uniref:Uncharacterized protein n=1 Tax=Prototheca wickerhamii TaxID=3111 RepID=A0AAD9IGD6_PROWI|nr:hypothetical protein QBZ16_005404 [Prototheca wickerhamii]
MNFREGIVRLVGEGYDQPQGDPNMVIDINYARLNEWLVDRKVAPRDWVARLRSLQAAVAEAAASAKIVAQDGQTPYGLARARSEALRGEASRTLLGGLKGEAGAWAKLAKAYEARALHAPAIKRSMARAQQQLVDLEARVRDARLGAAAADKAHRAECQRLGLRLCAEAVADDGLRRGADLYEALLAETERVVGRQAGRPASEPLPTLREVLRSETRPPPEPLRAETPASEEAAPSQIDFGIETELEAAPAEIAWDFEAIEAETEEAGVGAPVEVDPGREAAPVEISWDIELEEADAEAAAQPSSPQDDPTGATESNADPHSSTTLASLYGPDPVAQRLGEDAAYRQALSDDVAELRAFLRLRADESRRGALESPEDLEPLLAAVERAAAALQDPELTRLQLLRSRPAFVARQAAVLESKKEAGPRLARLAEDLEQRRLTIQRGLVRDSQLLEAKVAGMRETKSFIEKTLGAIIKRKILVTGDLLSASAKS